MPPCARATDRQVRRAGHGGEVQTARGTQMFQGSGQSARRITMSGQGPKEGRALGSRIRRVGCRSPSAPAAVFPTLAPALVFGPRVNLARSLAAQTLPCRRYRRRIAQETVFAGADPVETGRWLRGEAGNGPRTASRAALVAISGGYRYQNSQTGVRMASRSEASNMFFRLRFLIGFQLFSVLQH
jgi:hypothetical protein